MKLRRFEKIGAVFTEDFSSLAYLRNEGTTTSGSVSEGQGRGKKAIKIPTSSELAKGLKYNFTKATNFSWSVWLKYDDEVSAVAYPLRLTSTALDKTSLWVYMYSSSGIIYAGVNGSFKQVSNNFATSNFVNKWAHLVFTYDGSNAKVYIDGEFLSTYSLTGDFATNPTTLKLTNTSNTSTQYISDFMYFPYVLTAEDVSALYNGSVFDYEKHLVSKWDMSEPYVKDTGWEGNENDVYKIANISTSDVKSMGAGKMGIRFDGADNSSLSVSSSDEIDFKLGDEFSVCTNYFVYSFSSWREVVAKTDRHQYRLRHYTTDLRFAFGDTGTPVGTGVLTAKEYYNSASVGDKQRLYMNGDFLAEDDYPTTVDYTGGDLIFGAYSYVGGEELDGIIKSVKIYNKSLPQIAHKELNKNKERGL